MRSVSVLVALCCVAAAVATPTKSQPREFTNVGLPVRPNPRRVVNTESLTHDEVPTLRVTLQGKYESLTQRYWVEISVTDIPIYQPTAPTPPETETVIPDNDDIENIQVYFANKDGRILEVRFNRFKQTLGRLWKRPYHPLRDDVPLEVSGVTTGPDTYSMTILVPGEALPAQMDRVHAVVVDPTKEGGARYYTHYRLYNYPVAYDWNMKVYQLYRGVTMYNLVPQKINEEYSLWWEGIGGDWPNGPETTPA